MELDRIICGDCLDILPTLPDASVDAVITDPPYPHIKRDYGYWTTEEWWALVVEGVIPEVRRILKPTGSAVFILQPNSEHVGQMRGWLWEFMAWVCREWNMVQDVWWWNIETLPSGVSTPRERGLLRESLKACVWCGTPNSFRDQRAVLWSESDDSKARRLADRVNKARGYRKNGPSGNGMHTLNGRAVAKEFGGVTPFNVIPLGNDGDRKQGGARHGAGTPLKLADWWVRYIVPPGGVVCDPFFGVGTMGVAAVQNGCSVIGIDNVPGYIETARERVAEARQEYERKQQKESQMELAL